MSWPVVKLGDIFEIARGGSPRPIDAYITDAPDGLNWVMIGDATNSDKIIHTTKKKIRPEGLSKTRAVRKGDFILSNSMSFGRPYIMGTDGCIHDGWLLLRPRIKEFCADFFYHYLGSNEIYSKFLGLAAGATVKNLNSELVRSIEIPLPPLPEQKRIAAILDQADALRRLRARALEKVNTLGQAIYRSECEKASHETTLAEVATINPKCRKEISDDESVSFLPMAAVSEQGEIIEEEVRNYSEVRKGFTPFENGDILVAKITPCFENGKGCLVRIAKAIGFGSTEFHVIRTKDPLTAEWVHLVTRSEDFRRTGERRMTGSAGQKRVTRDFVATYTLPIPDESTLIKISAQLSQISSERRKAAQALDASNALFASLQHRAFRGEL